MTLDELFTHVQTHGDAESVVVSRSKYLQKNEDFLQLTIEFEDGDQSLINNMLTIYHYDGNYLRQIFYRKSPSSAYYDRIYPSSKEAYNLFITKLEDWSKGFLEGFYR